jgi:hypothetical protein
MINALDTAYEMGDGGDQEWVGRFVPDLDLKTDDGETRVAELLHAGRPVLIDLAGRDDLLEAATQWRDRVRVVRAVTPRDTPDTILVRPDGYVAWAGGHGEAALQLRAALTRWFGAAREN